jgi:DnaJ-class molecular chaperone
MPKCPDCNSTSDIFGLAGDGVCSDCHGDGKRALSGLNEAIFDTVLECNNCGGSGKCPTCDGTGEID